MAKINEKEEGELTEHSALGGFVASQFSWGSSGPAYIEDSSLP